MADVMSERAAFLSGDAVGNVTPLRRNPEQAFRSLRCSFSQFAEPW